MVSKSQTLVTGATGFIGRYLVRTLLARGETVRVLVRSEEKAHALFGDDVTCFKGDLSDQASLDHAVKNVETLYHIAGIYAFGRQNKKNLMQVNVTGTENILKAAHRAKVSKVVHVSSAGILARKKGGASEASFPILPPSGRPYKASKWFAEKVALSWVERGLSVVIANPTCPLGQEDNTPTGQIIRDFLAGEFTFSSHTGLNFLDVRDLATGLIACAERGRSGQRYVLGQHNRMLTDFLNILAKQTGLPGPKAEVPWHLIAACAVGSECLQSLGLLNSTRVCWETAQQSKFIQFFDGIKAEQELSWRPQRPLLETIDWTLEAYRMKRELEQPVFSKG